MVSFNLYDVLGVSQYASAEEIRSQYKKLALQFHPDKSVEDTKDHFQKIQDAYETLIDHQKRSKYDTKLRRRRRSSAARRSSQPKAQKPEQPASEPEAEQPRGRTGPGWKDPNWKPKQGINWQYYNDFFRWQNRGPTGGTQNFHHFDWSERTRFYEGDQPKPFEVPKLRKVERFPFTGNDKKVAAFKTRYHAHVESVKTQYHDAMDAQRIAYQQFALGAQLRSQKAELEWRELTEQLEADASYRSPAFQPNVWTEHMSKLAATQKRRQSEASNAVFTHAAAFDNELKSRKEYNREQEGELDVMGTSASGVIGSHCGRLTFDEYCEAQQYKLMQIKNISEAEEKTYIAKKITSLRAQQKEFEAMLEQKQVEFRRALYGFPLQSKKTSIYSPRLLPSLI